MLKIITIEIMQFIISNKNGNYNRNYQNTDSNINICQNYKGQSICSRENFKEKKEIKKYLSDNWIAKYNDNAKKININIKVNNYNKENNDNNNNNDDNNNYY